MAQIFDCSNPRDFLAGVRAARTAILAGELVVFPTDTVYGIAADAFNAVAVQKLLDAKGRTRQSPPPVLIPNTETLRALVQKVPVAVQKLVDEFWPGPLTIILPAQESLVWDLGETHGTVALRQPDDEIALALLAETGPLAVSSANLTGQTAASTSDQAQQQLLDSVPVYLDGGTSKGGLASTIVDATSHADDETQPLVILRQGALSQAQLSQAAGVKILAGDD